MKPNKDTRRFKLSLRKDPGTELDQEVEALIEKYKIKYQKLHPIVTFGHVYDDIRETGIRVFSDERLKDSCKELPKYSNLLNPSSITLTVDQFKRFILASRSFILAILKDKLVIPSFSLFEIEMSFFYEACKFDNQGRMYEKVPHLNKLNPNLWQLGFCSIDGQLHMSEPENLQSFPFLGISKLLLYALALDLLGFDVVHAYIGFHSTRKSFFERECLPPSKRTFRKPVNPATECGAVVLSSLIYNVGLKDISLSAKYDYVFSYIQELAGSGHIGTDKAIFISMVDNDSEFISLYYYLESCKAFKWPHNITKDLEFYLQINAFEANVESLSIIGATIANDGVNPFTKKRLIKKGHCQFLYNYMVLYSTGEKSATWVRKVGLPVAFGESGCCLLILPGVMAYSFISPNINELDLSLRSYKFIKSMCSLYEMNRFDSLKKEEEEKKSVCPYSCTMFRVVGDGDFFLMFSLIQMGMKPCVKDHLNETILHFAAAAGNLKCVEFLLSLCPTLLFKKDILGNTASKVASFFGHDKLAAFLELKEQEAKQHQTMAKTLTLNNNR